MTKVALQADLWYNKALKTYVTAMLETSRDWPHLLRRCDVDTLSPHDQNSNVPEKRCTGPCGRALPATLEFFHSNGKGGLCPKCKACKIQKQRTYMSNPNVHEQSLIKKKTYRARPEVKAQISEYNKSYKDRPEARASKRIRRQAFYSRPEKREHKQLHDRAYGKIYRQTPRGKALILANVHRRRARKKAVKGTYAPEQITNLLKRQKHKCYYCTTKFEKRGSKYIYEIDHTYPLNRVVGTDIPANDISYLVLACPTCNRKKGDKFPWEWPEGGRLL